MLRENLSHPRSFGDLFAGTGVVGASLNCPETSIIANELLYCNYCSLHAFLGAEAVDLKEYHCYLQYLREAGYPKDDYLARAYGGKYFGAADALTIGSMRQAIADLSLQGRMNSALIATLLYSMDRIANTCGHYDAFRLREPEDGLFCLRPLDLGSCKENQGNRIYNEDAPSLASRIECEVVYLDPPYNSRQYSDSYHVLENVARWSKPSLHGKARKFDRSAIKSAFNSKGAAKALATLVEALNCSYILFSYSNMEGRGDPRSQNKIRASEIEEILESRGDVEVFERPFRAFSAGKSKLEGHAERLFFCTVHREREEGDGL